MGRHTLDFHFQPVGSFPGPDQSISFLAGFTTKIAVMLRSQPGNQFPAAGRSDFFIPVEEQGDLLEILEMERPQLLHGEYHHIDAAFAIGSSWSFGPVPLDPEGPFCHGPFWEYSVQMSTGHDFPPAFSLKDRKQVTAFLRILHRDLFQGKRLQRFQFFPYQIRHLIDALSVPGSAVYIDQFFPVGDIRGKGFFTSLIQFFVFHDTPPIQSWSIPALMESL